MAMAMRRRHPAPCGRPRPDRPSGRTAPSPVAMNCRHAPGRVDRLADGTEIAVEHEHRVIGSRCSASEVSRECRRKARDLAFLTVMVAACDSASCATVPAASSGVTSYSPGAGCTCRPVALLRRADAGQHALFAAEAAPADRDHGRCARDRSTATGPRTRGMRNAGQAAEFEDGGAGRTLRQSLVG